MSCKGCTKRFVGCHASCHQYKKEKFVRWFFKEIERRKKENDLRIGVRSIEKHVNWRMRWANR